MTNRTTRAALIALALLAGPAAAQVRSQDAGYPSRPVRFVAPFAAGGGADVNVRRLGERLNRLWGQPVLVDNIAGAGGGVAAVSVAKSRPDGYTLLFLTHPILAIAPSLYEKLPYDPENDFTAIVHVSDTPIVLLVNPSLAASNVPELVALAKARPGTLNFGTGGVGTSLHLAGELFKAATGTDIAHVPYKGTAPALTALLGNEIQLLFDSSASALQRMQGGRVRGIAVASMTRLSAAPALPTFDESGVRDFVVTLAYGVIGPAGMPPALVATLNRDLNTVLSDAEYRAQMAEGGAIVIGGSPEQ